MITLRDSLRLAYTKIRTRQVRLAVVVFLSSFVFVGLIAGSVIVAGALESFKKFSASGLSGRYIVSGDFIDTSMFSLEGGEQKRDDPALIAEAEAREKALEERKKAEAKRLGIEYAGVDEASRAIYTDGDKKSLNRSSPLVAELLKERELVDPLAPTMERFKQQTGTGAVKHYQSKKIAGNRSDSPALSVIADGKEQDMNAGGGSSLKSIAREWTLIDTSVLEPFLLSGQNLEIGADGSVPIIASYSAAQELLKLPLLDTTANDADQKNRLLKVRQDVAGKTFQICYRNNTAQQQLEVAKQQQASIKANQGKAGYERPRLIYAPSQSPCAAPTVERDVRSAAEKSLTAKQDEFDRTFGKPAPVTEMLTLRVVGVSSDRSIPEGVSVKEILTSLLVPSIGLPWASPYDVGTQLPAAQDIFKKEYGTGNVFEPQERYFAEYSSATAARDVIKTKNCSFTFGETKSDGTACGREGRPFQLAQFGSISIALDEFQAGFRTVQLWVAIGVAIIAALLLMGMIGRIIADSRKETAVFRALGASRLSIAQIYVVYTLYLSILVIVVAFALGCLAALIVSGLLGPGAAASMALLFNVSDLSMPFHFFRIDPYDIIMIMAIIVGASLVASIGPIIANVRRSPIRDMRDE